MDPAVFTKQCGLVIGAVLLISAVATPSGAQVPGGSYLETCRNVQTRGDTLVADCQRVDGRWSRTGLDLHRCHGDIANWNGQLSCRKGHHRDDDDRRYDEDR